MNGLLLHQEITTVPYQNEFEVYMCICIYIHIYESKAINYVYFQCSVKKEIGCLLSCFIMVTFLKCTHKKIKHVKSDFLSGLRKVQARSASAWSGMYESTWSWKCVCVYVYCSRSSRTVIFNHMPKPQHRDTDSIGLGWDMGLGNIL